jgi:hypothetical protein
MQAQSIDTLGSTPQEFADKIRRDIVIYAKLVKETGARGE